MNHLFSPTSLQRYTDLKWQAHVDGMQDSMHESINLDDFFMDVNNINVDLQNLQHLHLQLHNTNQEAKTVLNLTTMKELRARMNSDVHQVIRQAKMVKTKLDELDKANLAHRRLPGCGPGTLAERTRTSVVGGLGSKLKKLMDEFQELRTEVVDEEVIERLTTREGSTERFMEVVMEVKERNDAVKEMERSLKELEQMFLDMAVLLGAQGEKIEDIESHVARANSFVRKGAGELQTAIQYQRKSRKWTCIALLIGLVVLALILVPVIVNVLRMG
ncbi:putative target SNARE coiled-coil domain, syntaxin domain, syntaxin/epimorphin [Dioscorea sansibarensis]